MSTLSKKIDFAILISVENANPNGDPLCGNRPREDYDGYGEISDPESRFVLRRISRAQGYQYADSGQ